MTNYLTYEQYTEFGGMLDEATFDELAFEAKSQIDWYTFHRLDKFDTIPEEVARCMFYLIKLIKEQSSALLPDWSTDSADGSGKIIASQSNDGVSVSYNILSASEVAEMSKQKINETISRYLNGVKDSLGRRILYRGLYPDE